MKLTDYIIDLGRVVAYYPNLKKLTNSTTASILLCQLLYWTNKTDDGWIWKDAYEIEEETGLTYNEQRTARKTLIENDLLKEEYKRLDHQIRFKINQEELNRQWEELGGKTTKTIEKQKKKTPEPVIEEINEKENEEKTNKIKEAMELAKAEAQERQVEVQKNKKDWLDIAVGDKAKEVNALVDRKKEIKYAIENKLSVVAEDSRWQKFIEFAYEREKSNGEDIDRFISWALQEGFDPLYWTPEKLKTMYPQAFKANVRGVPSDDFVKKLPPKEEKEYAPMPDSLRKKRN